MAVLLLHGTLSLIDRRKTDGFVTFVLSSCGPAQLFEITAQKYPSFAFALDIVEILCFVRVTGDFGWMKKFLFQLDGVREKLINSTGR